MTREQCALLYREQTYAAGTLPVSHETWLAIRTSGADASLDPWWVHRQPSAEGASALLLVHPELPCLAGHFPGAPILPGIVQIYWALQLADALLPGVASAAFNGLGSVKFLAPVQPGAIVLLTLEHQPSGRVQARLELPGEVCTRAVLRYRDIH